MQHTRTKRSDPEVQNMNKQKRAALRCRCNIQEQNRMALKCKCGTQLRKCVINYVIGFGRGLEELVNLPPASAV